MKLFLTRILLIILTIAYMALIWIQTSYFDPESVSIVLSAHISMPIIWFIGIILELTHLFEFGFLYLLIILVFLSFTDLSKGLELIAFSISFLYGLIDEIHQIYIPFRSASIGDLFKNTIGIVFMWWVIKKNYFNNRNAKIGIFLRKVSEKSTEK